MSWKEKQEREKKRTKTQQETLRQQRALHDTFWGNKPPTNHKEKQDAKTV